jgi:hypothetical protein
MSSFRIRIEPEELFRSDKIEYKYSNFFPIPWFTTKEGGRRSFHTARNLLGYNLHIPFWTGAQGSGLQGVYPTGAWGELCSTTDRNNPFMFDFMKAKILTALVGRSLENILGIGISTNSISETIWQLREASELITKRNQVVENKIAGVELEHAILAMVGAYNRCSLVEYPTAYHVDRFAKTNLEEFLKSYAIPGVRWKLSSDTEAKFRKMLNAIEEGRERDACVVAVPSLENKKLLEIPMPSRIGLRGIGRGGKGKGRYVVAVLDWRNGPQALRRQQYLAAGGTAERVTQAVFDAFFGV